MDKNEELRNEIYIGYNGSGKTKKIESIINDIRPKNAKNAKNLIYIPTEQNFKDEFEKEKTTGNGNFIFLIKELICEIFGKNDFTYTINKTDIEKIKGRKKYKEDISKFFSKLKDEDFVFEKDDYFKDQTIIETLKFDLEKYETPSGKNNYSLIKILGELLLYAKNNGKEIQGFKDYYLIIDEPEKFSHPILIKKIAYFLNEISKSINVILTTHSPIFLSYYIDDSKTKIFFNFNKSEEFIDFFILDGLLKELEIHQDKRVYRILKNKILRIDFFETLFSKKIILVEDITTRTFINFILEDTKDNEHSTLITFGWNQIDDFMKIYSKIKFDNKKIKILIDNDDDKKESYNKEGKNLNNIIYSFKKDIDYELDLSGKNGKEKTSASNLLNKNIDELKLTNAWKEIEKKLK